MFGTLLVMNETIDFAVVATASMALHWAMIFRGSLSETRHSVNLGIELGLFRVDTRLLIRGFLRDVVGHKETVFVADGVRVFINVAFDFACPLLPRT